MPTDSNTRGAERLHRALADAVEVLGLAYTPANKCLGYALRRADEADAPLLICKKALCGRAKTAAMETWLLDNDLECVLDLVTPAQFGAAIRVLAGSSRLVVLNQQGFECVRSDEEAKSAYAWNGKAYPFGFQGDAKLWPVEEALQACPGNGTAESWREAFGGIAESNPRLLIPLCVTLSSAIRRAFNQPALTIALSAKSSLGKTTIQRVCSSLIGFPEVEDWDGTVIGIQEWLSERPDRVSCLEDVQKGQQAQALSQIIMAVGNSARRKVSRNAPRATEARAIQTTLIVSTEKSFLSGDNRATGGVLARYFEIREGAHGMFDSLCGLQDGGELARALNDRSSQNYGTIWPCLLRRASREWESVQRWHAERVPQFRAAILEGAGSPELDPISCRVLNSLAFAAFAGYMATRLRVWSIQRRNIISAFATALREHVEHVQTHGTNPESRVVEVVQAYIEGHRAQFAPIADAASPGGTAGIVGYRFEHRRFGELFLFPAATFEGLFFKKFGDFLFEALRTTGFLVTQGKRHNRMSVRIPGMPQDEGHRMNCVAISGTIRFA